MRMSKLLKEAQSMAQISPKTLALEIVDIVNQHHKGIHLNGRDRYIAGLAYSEFWADENDDNYDNSLVVAEEKCAIVRKVIGLPEDFGYRVDGLFQGKDRFREGWKYGED